MTSAPAASTPLSLYSIVIPARDEVGSLPSTLATLHDTLTRENIPHEIVVVDDGSTDGTWSLLQELRGRYPTLAPVQNPGPHGRAEHLRGWRWRRRVG